MKRIKILSFVIMAIAFVAVFMPETVFADKDLNLNSTYYDRMLFSSVVRCIRDFGVLGDKEVHVSDIASINRNELFSGSGANRMIPLPSSKTGMQSDEVTCQNLFLGDGLGTGGGGTFNGVLSTHASSIDDAQLLELFGYEQKNGSGATTKAFVFSDNAGHSIKTASVSVVSGGGDTVVGSPSQDNTTVVGNNGSGSCGSIPGNIVTIEKSGELYSISFNSSICLLHNGNAVKFDIVGTKPGDSTFMYHSGTIDGFFEALRQKLYEATGGGVVKYTAAGLDIEAGYISKESSTIELSLQENPVTSIDYNAASGKEGDTWVPKSGRSLSVVASEVVKVLSGDKYNIGNLTFTPKEALTFYVAEIEGYFFSGMNTNDYWICDSSVSAGSGTGYVAINLFPTSGSGFQRPETSDQCKIKVSSAKNGVTSGFLHGLSHVKTSGDDTYVDFMDSDALQLYAVIERMNELVPLIMPNPGDSTELDIEGVTAPDDGGTAQIVDGSGTVEQKCGNSGGAISLGWILCPALELMGKASVELYDNVIKPNLRVEPKLFKDGGATEEAWNTFRNFANVIFAALLLFVIFSQLTGVGIDNYGIKRILPKLIVVAIMVNMSYIICSIFIDLSNILGNAIQGLFEDLGVGTASVAINGATGANTVISLAKTAGSVAILGGIVAMTGSFWGNPAVLLSLLVSALSALISLFFLFVLLSVRQAAIVVLTVASPAAFVLYTLPNTKKVFDRWMKAWEGLLLLYPIAGALVGGGNYVSRLLLSVGFGAGGIVAAMTAMIIGIVPIFFIPSVLKNSFAAIGNIGNKISGFGAGIRKSAEGATRNTEAFKNAARLGNDSFIRRRAGLDEHGNLTEEGKKRAARASKGWRKALGYDRNIAAYQVAAKKTLAEKENAGATLTNALAKDGIADAGSAEAYYTNQFEEAAKSGNISAMNGAIAAAVSSGYMKDKDIAKMVRNTQNAGNINIGDDATRASWYRDLATKYGNGFMATDYELKHYAMNGGALRNENGTERSRELGGYGEYAAAAPITPDEIKPEDLNRLSGDSLAGLIAGGTVNAQMAREALKSSNLSQDKRVMLGAHANEAVNLPRRGDNIQDWAKNFKEQATTLVRKPQDSTGAIQAEKGQIEAWMAPSIQEVKVSNLPSNSPSGTSTTSDTNGGAAEGQTFQVQPQSTGLAPAPQPTGPALSSQPTNSSALNVTQRGGATSAGGIILPTSEEARKTMLEFDHSQRNNRNYPGNGIKL